jgi:hypothetical protein
LVIGSNQFAVIDPFACAENVCVVLWLDVGEKPDAAQCMKTAVPPALQLHDTVDPTAILLPLIGWQVNSGGRAWALAHRVPASNESTPTTSATASPRSFIPIRTTHFLTISYPGPPAVASKAIVSRVLRGVLSRGIAGRQTA